MGGLKWGVLVEHAVIIVHWLTIVAVVRVRGTYIKVKDLESEKRQN